MFREVTLRVLNSRSCPSRIDTDEAAGSLEERLPDRAATVRRLVDERRSGASPTIVYALFTRYAAVEKTFFYSRDENRAYGT